MQDFRFAVRQLLKTPGFTSVAVLTLALAIGVNSAIFALINGVLLKPVVPVRPAEVVNVFTARQNASHDYRQFSYNEYRELRANGKDVFVDVAALEFAVAGIGRDHEMRRSFAFLTSENYFPMLGVQAFRGRFYNAEECKPNANMAVLVSSYGFWKRNGARDDFVGSTIQINGQPYTVIGIAPDGFSGANALIAPDIWLPLGIRSQFGSAFGDSETTHDLLDPKNYTFNLVARMRSGLTIDAAKARLPVLAQRLNAIQPDGSEGARELQIQTPARFGLSHATGERRTTHVGGDIAYGDGRSGPAHRLFKSREHVARARHIAFEGNRSASGCRRITLADRQAIIVRRVFAGCLRRRHRPDSERLVQRCFTPTTAAVCSRRSISRSS